MSGHGLPQGRKTEVCGKSKYAKHAEMPQRLYLRFLYAKRTVCSRVPEFAAYFGKESKETFRTNGYPSPA